jgi:serine/threonine protein phosphatase PrpC
MPAWPDLTKIKDLIQKAPNKDDATNNNNNNKKIDTTNKNTSAGNEPLSSTTTKYHHENQQRPQQKGIGFASDIGLTRPTDEDSILIMDLMTAFEGKKRRKVILILADGMGGHSKGEVASKIGTRTIATELQQFLGDTDMNERKYYDLLTNAFLMANSRILHYTENHPEAEGMGTTISVAVMDEGQELYIGNVGDSRVYIINREEGAIQLTKDDTFVQELIDKGKITKEEARRHPKRNVLNQAVGSVADIVVDTSSLRLDNKDYVLLCCDGLINHISDDEMADIVLNNNASPQEACDRLIALANKRGGKDNISVIIAPADMMKS